MELSVITKRKKMVQDAIARNKKSVRIIKKISKIMLFIGVVGGGLYALINAVMPNMCMTRVNGVVQKDVDWLFISTTCIVTPCLLSGVCLKALAINLGGVDNSARVDESLLMDDIKIRYSFRFKYQDATRERKVIIIDYSRIDFVNYDEVTGELDFKGNILVEFYDDYRDQKPVEKSKLDEWKIYDYFTPSLKEILEKKGVKVNITNWRD